MCDFITISLPKATSDTIMETLPKDLICFVTHNKSIATHLSSDYISYGLLANSMCSCGLFHPANPEGEEREKEALIRKYKKKGWSESKIQRAISEHEASISMKNKTYGFREDLLAWFISAAHSLKGNVSILIHFGDIHTDVFDIQQDSIKLETFPSYQETFPQDTLVKINN